MGTRINPTKVSDIPVPSTSPSMLSTRNSAQTATMTVETTRLDINDVTDRGVYSPIAYAGVIVAYSVTASVSSAAISSYRYECDLS
jgi:hypothetical protein